MAKKANYRVASIAPKKVRKDWQEEATDNAQHKYINTIKDVKGDSEDEFHQQRDQVQLEEYAHEILGEQSDVEVLALASDSSSDYDEEETDRMDRLSKQLLPKAAFSDDDQAEVDEDLSEEDEGWGQSRNAFYSNEQVAQDDAHVALEEEQEALRLQSRQSARMNQTDYIDDSFAALLQKRLDDTSYKSDDDEAQENETAEESVFDMDGLCESSLSPEEKRTVLASVMPEVPELIEDFKERHREYQALETAEMTHLLLTKKRLLASYLMNLSFYFLLKVDDRLEKRGKSQKDHPVVGVLIELRDMLDAVAEVENGSDAESGDESMDSDAMDEMLEDEMIDGEEIDSEEEMIEGELIESDEDMKHEDLSMSEDGEGFSEMSGSELEELLKQDEKKPNPKPLFDIALQTIPSFSTSTLTSSVKRKKKKPSNDFGEEEDEADIQDSEMKRKSLKFHVTRVDKNIVSRARKSNKFGGDDDLPIKLKRPAVDHSLLDSEEDVKPVKKQKTPAPVKPTQSNSDSEYETLKQSKSLLKLQKRDAYTAKLAQQLQVAPVLAPSQKRAIDYQISANKGLTPHRPKIDRNPRVKRRVKYETAMKKLKDFRRVAVDKGSLGEYVGEASGIKTRLARSVKL